MKKNYDIAAYVWPAYSGSDMRNRIFWPEGDGEWQTVRNSVPKANGYNWGRSPLLGCEDEADSKVMERQIDLASDHGVNVFIYDWYWYDGRPFQENCLNDGFLKASNCDKMKFYLMWANHDFGYTCDIRNSQFDEVVWRGAVDRDEFKIIVKRVIERYFKQDNYYKIDGAPVFMIYELGNFIDSFGGIAQTIDAIQYFRDETLKAGFPALHLQLTAWGNISHNYSGVDGNAITASVSALVDELGFDSISNYQFAHLADMHRDYMDILPDIEAKWLNFDKNYNVPYFAHVSVGWDNNPRFNEYRYGVVTNNTPANFKIALEKAKEYADTHSNQPPLITINSWNEWTETSYLLPDNVNGYGYLEAIREVFK